NWGSGNLRTAKSPGSKTRTATSCRSLNTRQSAISRTDPEAALCERRQCCNQAHESSLMIVCPKSKMTAFSMVDCSAYDGRVFEKVACREAWNQTALEYRDSQSTSEF